MTTKDEYGDALRELLDTDIEFEKMTKEDLIKLTEIFSNPGVLIEKLDVENAEKKITRERIIERGKEIIEDREGPVIDIVKEIVD